MRSHLGLAGDDSTGMWMLNYPFPYDSRRVGEAFASLCRLLVDAVESIGRSSFRSKLDAYLKARSEFAHILDEKDYKYFSFQVWQEGIARYTEYALVRRAGVAYTPTSDYMSLPDRVPFDEGRLRDSRPCPHRAAPHVVEKGAAQSRSIMWAPRRGFCSMR